MRLYAQAPETHRLAHDLSLEPIQGIERLHTKVTQQRHRRMRISINPLQGGHDLYHYIGAGLALPRKTLPDVGTRQVGMVCRDRQHILYIFQAQVDALSGQRMHYPHGVADQQHPLMRHALPHPLLRQRKAEALVDCQNVAQAMLDSGADFSRNP